MSLFDYDGIFMRVCNFISNSFLITILWIITSLPILTIGASTTAAYEVSFNFIRKNEGSMISQYFRSFKRNMKQTIPTGIIILFLILNGIFFSLNPGLSNQMGTVFSTIYLVLMVELILIGIYVFPLLSKLKCDGLELLKVAFIMSHTNLLSSIMCLGLLISIVIVIVCWPPLVLMGVGLYCLSSSFYINRLFNKYHLI